MARSKHVLVIIAVALVSAALAAKERRFFDRLFFADHTLSWQIATNAEGAYTGFQYAPFNADLDGALFPVGRMPVLDVRLRAEPSKSGGRAPITLAALLTPPPHQVPPHLSYAQPPPSLQALAGEVEGLPGGALVQWDLKSFVAQSWQPVTLSADSTEFTALRTAPGSVKPQLSLKVPSPWAVVVFCGNPDGGRVQVSTGKKNSATHDLRGSQPWIAVLVAPPGRTPAAPRTHRADYTASFGGESDLRFLPLVSAQPTTSVLTKFALDGRTVELSELQQWPHTPGLTAERRQRGLQIQTTSAADFLEIPRSLIKPSHLRPVLGWALATLGLTLLGLAGLRLLVWISRINNSALGAPPAGGRIPSVVGRGWVLPCLAALALHLTYYMLSAPITDGAGQYYAKVAHHLWAYAASGVFYFYRTPFHVLYLRGLFELADSPECVALVQHLLSVVSVYLVWRIARRVGLPQVLAACAALLVALHPRLHYFASTYWNETLVTCLLLISAELLLVSMQRGWRWAVLAGLACAAAALTRPQYQFVMGLALLVYFVAGGGTLRRRAGLALGALLGFFILATPWLVYNRARNIPGFALSHAHLAAYNYAPEIPAVRRSIDWYGPGRKHTIYVRGLDLPRLNFNSTWQQVREFHAVIRKRVAQQKAWQAELCRRKPRAVLALVGRMCGFQAAWLPRPAGVFAEDLQDESTRDIRLRENAAAIAPWRIKLNDWLADWYHPAIGCAYALAVLGAIMAVVLRRREGLLLAGMGLGNAALLSVILLHSRRYTLPTEPFVILLAAWSLWVLLSPAWRRIRAALAARTGGAACNA